MGGVRALALLLLGAVTAVAAVAVHATGWGLVLGVAAVAATVAALPPGWTTRLAFGVGLVGGLGLLSVRRPEGDYVIAADLEGYLLLGLGLAVVVAGVATLPRPAGVRRGGDVATGT
jgi:hypothetical protein